MRKVLLSILSVVLICLGSFTIWSGMNQPPENTPQVEEPISAPKDQKPVGPTSAEINTDGESKEMSLPDMEPNHLFIPALEVYTLIDTSENFGQISKGLLVLPPPKSVTRWVEGSNVRDPKGSILLSGHISYNGTRGAVYHLADIKAGNIAYVSDEAGLIQSFQLETLDTIRKSSLPENVWDLKGPKKLTVVTCGGKLLKRGKSWTYDSNIIATFIPVK